MWYVTLEANHRFYGVLVTREARVVVLKSNGNLVLHPQKAEGIIVTSGILCLLCGSQWQINDFFYNTR
jgi:hypothetical protein